MVEVMTDHRTKVILALSIVIIALLAFVTVGAYNNQKVNTYNQGIQDGALLQQQNMLRSIQATGFFSMNLVGQDGQPVSIVLTPVQAPQQQAQQ
tara:strand:- start:241 stop:522 length:282 start_codon:yes stop_codon:yes gene_type:complete